VAKLVITVDWQPEDAGELAAALADLAGEARRREDALRSEASHCWEQLAEHVKAGFAEVWQRLDPQPLRIGEVRRRARDEAQLEAAVERSRRRSDAELGPVGAARGRSQGSGD
jgi:hypothetical protein